MSPVSMYGGCMGDMYVHIIVYSRSYEYSENVLLLLLFPLSVCWFQAPIK